MAVLTYNGLFFNEFKKLLRERITDEMANVANGSAQTFEGYREQVGVIRGLTEAVEICEEAVKKADQHERGVG